MAFSIPGYLSNKDSIIVSYSVGTVNKFLFWDPIQMFKK